LQTELNGFFQQVTGATLESCQVTASALCKARHKLDPAVFEALNQVVQAQRDAQGLRERWRGLRLLGIDGSSVHLPLVRVDLPGGATEVLATSLLDAQAFPAADFAELYHRRWGIETDYRRLKQTLNLENFSGRSPQAVQQDLHARILLKNLALLMQTLQQPEIDRRHARRKHRWQPNFTQGLSCLRNSLVRLLLNPTRVLLPGLLELMASALGAIRPGRSSPRKRRRRATKGCEGYKPTC
jgi:hypothetical protein